MLREILGNKPALFSVTVCAVIAILAVPVIIPHMLHGQHMVHIALHIGGLALAIFIATLAALSHHRTKSRRMMISFLAFGCFAASEAVQLTDNVWPFMTSVGPLSLYEMNHLLVFSVLGLLALAVFRND